MYVHTRQATSNDNIIDKTKLRLRLARNEVGTSGKFLGYWKSFNKLGANKSNIFVDEFFLEKKKNKKKKKKDASTLKNKWEGKGDGENLEQKSKKKIKIGE